MQIPGFKIEQLIAEGGMSAVYLALQKSLDRRVALKVLKKFDNPQHAQLFLDEARFIASLQHRNIITIYDVGVIGERHYIAMEYLEGGSLADRIEQGIPPAEALELLENMASCLEFVHGKGIVHRDIKPGNILFHADGTPKLTDFGIARQVGSKQEVTLDGSAFGSPYYISPEQAEGRPLDGRSDLYGLGIVFYQMLTGRRPYAQGSHIETILAHLSEPIPDLPGTLSAYQGLLERMLAKRPEDRIACAEELTALIRRVRPAPSRRKVRPSDAGRVGATAVASAGDYGRAGISRSGGLAAVAGLLLIAAGVHFWPSDQAGDPVAAAAIGEPSVAAALDAPKVVSAEAEIRVSAPPAEEQPPEQPSVAQATAGPEASPVGPATASASVEQRPEQPPADDGSAAPTLVVAAESRPLLQASEDSAQAVADAADPELDSWMQAGDSALKANRLTVPADDNAYLHYSKVLERDPEHAAARAGMDRIADRYLLLADRALAAKNYRRADLYVRRGMAISPGHRSLRKLRGELESVESRVAAAPEPAPVTKTAAIDPDTRVSVRGREGTGNIIKDFQTVWRSIFN